MSEYRKTILYIAMSLDGYIAKPGDDLDFLKLVEQPGEDYGYSEFIESVDTVIIGRRTYDWVMAHVPEFVHADKTTYVMTRTAKESIGQIHFHTGSLASLISSLKAQPGKHIFLDGGAQVVHELLMLKLIDELIISIIPVMVGDGIRLFGDGRPEQELELLSSTSFEKGLLQVHYKCKN